jgi:hypothetical protein
MRYLMFDVVEELEKAVQGRKTRVQPYALLWAIAGVLRMSGELKPRKG